MTKYFCITQMDYHFNNFPSVHILAYFYPYLFLPQNQQPEYTLIFQWVQLSLIYFVQKL